MNIWKLAYRKRTMMTRAYEKGALTKGTYGKRAHGKGDMMNGAYAKGAIAYEKKLCYKEER